MNMKSIGDFKMFNKEIKNTIKPFLQEKKSLTIDEICYIMAYMYNRGASDQNPATSNKFNITRTKKNIIGMLDFIKNNAYKEYI